MKTIQLLLLSLLLVTQSYAFSKSEKKLLFGLGAGAIFAAALHSNDTHITKVHHSRPVYRDSYDQLNKYERRLARENRRHEKELRRENRRHERHYNKHHKRVHHYSYNDRHHRKHHRDSHQRYSHNAYRNYR